MLANLFKLQPSRDESEHQRVQRLLPWLVNGTLERRELEWVERHVARCQGCQSELEEQSLLARELRAMPEPALSPHPARVRALLVRIDASGSGSPHRRHRRFLDFRGRGEASVEEAVPRGIWALVALQAAVVLVIGAVLLVERNRGLDATRFHTLSAPEQAFPQAGGARLRLVFEESASAAEIRRVLESVSGRIVDGPTPLGVYTVELAPLGEAARVGALEALRSEPSVRFVEPVKTQGSDGPERR